MKFRTGTFCRYKNIKCSHQEIKFKKLSWFSCRTFCYVFCLCARSVRFKAVLTDFSRVNQCFASSKLHFQSVIQTTRTLHLHAVIYSSDTKRFMKKNALPTYLPLKSLPNSHGTILYQDLFCMKTCIWKWSIVVIHCTCTENTVTYPNLRF